MRRKPTLADEAHSLSFRDGTMDACQIVGDDDLSTPAMDLEEPDHTLVGSPESSLVALEDYLIGGGVLSIVSGDLTDVRADAWVSSDDALLSMGGGVSWSIMQVAGAGIRDEVERRLPAEAGSVLVTSGGRAPVEAILHAVTIGTPQESGAMAPDLEVIEVVLANIAQTVEERGFSSLALPAIGTGAAGLDLDQVVGLIINTAASLLVAVPHLDRVVLVVRDSDERLLDVIRRIILDSQHAVDAIRRGTMPAQQRGFEALIRLAREEMLLTRLAARE